MKIVWTDWLIMRKLNCDGGYLKMCLKILED
jgi:hypothetical protein